MVASLASLDSLPTEILTEIMSYITDLKTLYNLITASPEASHIFNSSTMGPEILEIVLRSSMAPQVYGLVRFVAIVRTSTPDNPPAASLDAFVKRANQHTQKSGHGRFHSTSPPLTHTYRGQKPGSVRSILQIARRVAYLTPACLAYYRARWLTASPLHPDERHARMGVQRVESALRGPALLASRCRPAGLGRGTPSSARLLETPVAPRAAESRLRESLLGSTFNEAHRSMSWETLCKGLRYEKEEFLTVSDFVDHVRAGRPGSPWSLPVPSASSGEWPDQAPPVAVDGDAGHSWGFFMSQNAVGWCLCKWYRFSAQDGPYKMYTWRSLLSKEVWDEVENGVDSGPLRREMRRIQENDGFGF